MESQFLLFHANCPSCGAEIGIHSATALTAICGYCHSVLMINNDKLIKVYQCSAVLSDLSPLQIGTIGEWKKKQFVLVGRIQVYYDAGMWNEWHALFNDGSSGWLSEAGDRFVFTQEKASELVLPKPLQCGNSVLIYAGHEWIVSDIRQIQQGNFEGEGELPCDFPVQQPVHTIDLRSGKHFMTLEYDNNSVKPTIFIGEGVTLAALKLQNIRSTRQIRDQSGQIKGELQADKCPHCGGSIQGITGLATYIVCQYCQSSVSLSQGRVQLLKAENKRRQQENNLTIKIGSEAWIDFKRWLVLGAVVMQEISPRSALDHLKLMISPFDLSEEDEDHYSSTWTEYLLYAPESGFLWLIEQDHNQWALGSTLDEWPEINYPSTLIPKGPEQQNLCCLYDYGGQVLYAAGAFYWEIYADDINYYRDFGTEQHKLSTTLTFHEQTWSVITNVPASAVATWFEKDEKIDIQAKLLPVESANSIMHVHQGITVKDFRNKDLLHKWRMQQGINSLKKMDEPAFWTALIAFFNIPLALIGWVVDSFYAMTVTIGICFVAGAALYGVDFKNMRKFYIYYALIIFIIFTSINLLLLKQFAAENNFSAHGYSTGRWHK